jgi:hypothetical protein
MKNLEIIETECIFINSGLLVNPTHRPIQSTSKVNYVMLLDPISWGDENEYMTGEYDEVITTYFEQLVTAFDQLEVEKGLRPAMSFEDFMGDLYKGEPLQTTADLEYRIKLAMEHHPLPEGIPTILADDITKRREKYLTDRLIDVKLENYAKTDAEFEYIKLYNEYYEKYQNLFKPWPDENP